MTHHWHVRREGAFFRHGCALCALCLALCLLCLAAAPAQAARAPARGVERVTLLEAVRRALRDNPGIAAATERALGAEAGRKAARGAFGPKLGASYGVSKSHQDTYPAVVQRVPEAGRYTAQVNVTQPLFTGFKLLSSYQRAALQAESQQSALTQSRLELVEQVQVHFLAYLRARDNERSTADAMKRLREQHEITSAYYDVGLRPQLDVLQAEVDVSEAERLHLQARNSRDTAHAMLNALLGLAPTDPVEYVGELTHVPFGKGLEDCLNVAYAQRPDLHIAQKAVEIAEKDQKIVQSQYYPQVEGYYSISSYGNTPGLERHGENGGRGTTWEVGAQAKWDVFSWGTTYYADKEAGHNVKRLKHEAANLRLNAGYEVKSRLLALREAEKRIYVAEKSLKQAEEAYRQAQALYQEQVGTNFDVLNASAKLTAAQASLTGAKADYLTALSALYKAMGEQHDDLLAR